MFPLTQHVGMSASPGPPVLKMHYFMSLGTGAPCNKRYLNKTSFMNACKS